MTTKTTAGLLLIAGILGWFVYTRIQAIAERPASGLIVSITDTSVSVPRDCNALVDIVRTKANGMYIGPDSNASFLTTGRAGSSYEPELILQTRIPPKSGASIVSGAGTGQTREGFYQQVRAACEGFVDADASSIHRAVEIGLNHLQARCTNGADCVLILNSDLIENANFAVAQHLGLVRSKRKVDPPAKLDNTGVSVTVCGYVVNTGGSGPRTDGAALLERFRSLFVRPETVVFLPYCSDIVDRTSS
jgi:hypothetical protein